MIDLLFEHYDNEKDKREKIANMNFYKKAFNYISSFASLNKTTIIDYKDSSVVDTSIISFLISSFYENFENIKINFIVSDFINFNSPGKFNNLDYIVYNNKYFTYKYIDYALNEKDIPELYINLKNENKINYNLLIQDIFFDYSRYLNEDLLCDYKRTIALFYTFNQIFKDKHKIEYNYDNLFYYIFGFFDYKYVLMIKYKIEYIEENKSVLKDYIDEIDLRVSSGLFKFGSYKRFTNITKFKNKYKMIDNEIIYNLMNFEEFYNSNRWGISIGFYESLKFLTFIKEDWNDNSINQTELGNKIYNWYKDILSLSNFIKTKFKSPQVMQYSSYIFD